MRVRSWREPGVWVQVLMVAVLGLGLALMGACGDAEMEGAECELECPGGWVAVERCPAFGNCMEVEACGGEILCQEQEDEEDNQVWNEPSCEEEVQCPAGSEEVGGCGEEDLCTRVTLCGEELLCKEDPNACAQEPLCPGEDRAVSDYTCQDEDPLCYRRYHCSGPVVCLVCAYLPEECPEGFEEVGEQECGEGCEVVETCEERIYCQVEVCEEPLCPGESVERGECGVEEEGCFEIEGCQGPIYCGAEEEDEDCRAVPVCPAGYVETELAACLADLMSCELLSECGELLGCLPEL